MNIQEYRRCFVEIENDTFETGIDRTLSKFNAYSVMTLFIENCSIHQSTAGCISYLIMCCPPVSLKYSFVVSGTTESKTLILSNGISLSHIR